MDPYSTHLPMLMRALMRLEKGEGVLELGCGDYSTPLLKEFCVDRPYEVASSDEEWASKYRDIVKVRIVDWETERFTGSWGLVFLDNEQSVDKRIEQIPVLMRITRMLVMHDASHIRKFRDYTEGYEVEMYEDRHPFTALIWKR